MSEEKDTQQEEEKVKQVKMGRWHYIIIYRWLGRPMAWLLAPALRPMLSEIIAMIMETRSRLDFHENQVHRIEDGGDLKVENEVTINTGIKPADEE